MATTLKNVIVVGGSYVGKATAQELARIIPSTHRVLLIEPHSHFHHLFAFVCPPSTVQISDSLNKKGLF
jgi:2-polyprenyl-6-methoxyphenol hydroxylase-like FAD-dependent oxidoreductase